ncbi:DUF7266 family protein [Halapricum desulfuricans]|uniref:Pilin/Flagellin, FlaG/FlaF family n=1 Tax=Halapricum desulfuricans TaxID=2841257 RepID=A0A897NRT5_9EURY|nr:hypothetical protein [Halapricum desulfuricans]QSG15124.1 Pilin/Flagellin, FlaG/FlaF family [Halapricum desulfuricans]
MRDERGVSMALGYVLGLSIAFLLVAGLFVAGGNFVQEQRETSVRTEMAVISEQIASDMESADRLAQSTDNGTIVVERSLPSRVSGSGYTVSVEGGADPRLVLRTRDPDVEITAHFSNVTAVESTETTGGPIQVVYENGALVLERRDR